MVPVGRLRWLQLLEEQGARPRGRWSVKAQPRPPFRGGEGRRCPYCHAARVCRRPRRPRGWTRRPLCPLVHGELVASASGSSVRVPSPSLVRSRRHLGRGGEGEGAGPLRGGRRGFGGERYSGVVVSRYVVVQGGVRTTSALRQAHVEEWARSPQQYQQCCEALRPKHRRSQQRRQAHVQQWVRSPQQYQQYCEALRPKHLRSQQRRQARVQKWLRSPPQQWLQSLLQLLDALGDERSGPRARV